MNNELKNQLTEMEFTMLEKIVSYYTFDDNVCYMQKLTSSQKGVIGSLVKKGLVYDSFEGICEEDYTGNWFPSDEVLDLYKLEHY